jgi:hypothetical protein
MTNEEKIDFIDTFLSQCEDYMHGQDGKDVTLSRRYLREIAKQVKNSVVLADVSISDDEIMRIAVDKVSNNNYTWNFDYGVDMAKWMRDKLLNH